MIVIAIVMGDRELEAFRAKWKKEVERKKKGQVSGSSLSTKVRPKGSVGRDQAPRPKPATKEDQPSAELQQTPDSDDGQTIHHSFDNDGPEGESSREGQADGGLNQDLSATDKAIKLFERACEREDAGQLGDSLRLYRQAYRLDDRVDRAYREKHFPSKKPPAAGEEANPQSAASRPPPTASSLETLLADFSSFSLHTSPPEHAGPPPNPPPIASLPPELQIHLLRTVALSDPGSLSRLTSVCKRFAYLILTEDLLWRALCLSEAFGFSAMHYTFACTILGRPLSDSSTPSRPSTPTPRATDEDLLPLTTRYPSYRQMYAQRPRLRFSGLYIATANYTRAGAADPSQITWHSPVHVVTYHRYLRFFRDGTCLSLLSNREPREVVPWFNRENVALANHEGALRGRRKDVGGPAGVVRGALRGRWRLSGADPLGPGGEVAEQEGRLRERFKEREESGEVFVETEGVPTGGDPDKYTYVMQLGLGSVRAGAGVLTSANNKLAWRGFWSYNRLTDDWAEFGLRHDKPFYWSRVGSYGVLGG